MFQSTVAPSADRFRGRRGGSMRIAFPSEDEVAAKDFIGFAALSRTLFPPLCSRIVLKTTLTAGGTPRQRRMEGGEERKKRFAERSLRAALPHEGASGPAVDTCCLSPVWNTGCLCGNERCRPCRSKGTRHAQSHQHYSTTERMMALCCGTVLEVSSPPEHFTHEKLCRVTRSGIMPRRPFSGVAAIHLRR